MAKQANSDRNTPRRGDEVPSGTGQSGEAPCRACDGSGRIGPERCEECRGTGKVIVLVGDA